MITNTAREVAVIADVAFNFATGMFGSCDVGISSDELHAKNLNDVVSTRRFLQHFVHARLSVVRIWASALFNLHRLIQLQAIHLDGFPFV